MLKTTVIGFRGSVQHLLFCVTVWAPVLIVLARAIAAAADVDKTTVYAPYVVAVLKKQILNCSGFLISKQYVGVGCHCIASLEQRGRPRLNGLRLEDYDFVAGQFNPNNLSTAEHKRKPRALLTHPYCENEPPVVYDVGIAVLQEPFPTIKDTIEVYDFLSTDSAEFARTLIEKFSWVKPEDAPNCTLAGWRISSIPEKHQLLTMEMIWFPPAECEEKWRKEDPNSHPRKFNFSYPEQFCLVTRDIDEDDTYLPNDGPIVCDRLYVGLVSYGPERRRKTREVPVVDQSLAVMVEWIQFDSYFERVGCYGKDADCRDEEELKDKIGKSVAAKNAMTPCIVIASVHTLSILKS